ncbi:hypothetical protein CMUST_03475 [Corynebacterium mustelae]|uniref:Uncharacterized protein n=1 Tax=Corynebacterium mustelae TaxID=571915 RepID=A0A0G3GV50_9CORY|nr:hypothetical protein CMUST_03475 [Corynebacterium mustelae]
MWVLGGNLIVDMVLDAVQLVSISLTVILKLLAVRAGQKRFSFSTHGAARAVIIIDATHRAISGAKYDNIAVRAHRRNDHE